ncbi:hypothetical protein [Brevibacillus daliensis]|uniref:hypothetical protein n=1 Tax=Brevibacillus daliensis TaxID=2892995 RepID=UPI001E4DFD07|nr:hypothetical protein [Brevibacillus daliensis]
MYRSDPGTGTDPVPGNSPIVFSNLSDQLGTAFSFTAPSSTVTINQTGYYFFSVEVHNQSNADFNLVVGGSPVTPTPLSGNGGGPIAATFVLNITSVPAAVQIVNPANNPVNLHNGVNTTLTILKLS